MLRSVSLLADELGCRPRLTAKRDAVKRTRDVRELRNVYEFKERCIATGSLCSTVPASFRLMARLRVLFENGDPERTIDFERAKAPFQHDGKPGSILDVLLAHGIHLEHACGGNCACTTCHVILKQGFDDLSEAEENELDLLDRAPGLTPTSRLGCQAVIEKDSELTVLIPRFTINQS